MDYKIKSDERLPNLIIQCVSFDFWQNRRIEGYGHISIPTQTGIHELNIPCWRPKQGLEQDLRRFFLGGSSELITPSASVGFNKNLNKVCGQPWLLAQKYQNIDQNKKMTEIGFKNVRMFLRWIPKLPRKIQNFRITFSCMNSAS